MRDVLRCASLALFLVAPLAACDTEINEDFEQQLADAQARQSGDPFANLGDVYSSFGNYASSDPMQRSSYLGYYGGQAEGAVGNALSTLETMAPPADAATLIEQCRQAYEDALAFRRTPPDAEVSLKAAQDLTGVLQTCRSEATEKEESSEGDEQKYYDALKRIASTSMVVVAIAAVDRGHVAEGEAMWRSAGDAVRDDRPGFRLRLQHFLGYY